MSRKFSYQGVVVVIIFTIIIAYYFILFRNARQKDLDQQSRNKEVLINNQK